MDVEDSAGRILREVFGYPRFRGEQRQIIDHVMAGGDALVLMPTGGGKSLCYQIPALAREGMGVVVSPLIALMQDQVAALHEAGVRAAALNSAMSWPQAQETERQARAGELDLLYVAPERLLTERCLSLLDRCRLALFAIDEAHCVSQWGHDFRPEYLQLAVLAERYRAVPRMALTATADSATRTEMIERLRLREPRVFVASFDRPNIRYRIAEKDNPRRQLLRFIREEHAGESGIVYCLARATVEDTAALLAREGVDALPYHAGLDSGTREDHQRRFIRDDGIVMVATIAFGMGIDRPDVRFVVHLDMPDSPEAYYQQIGRAGRDGDPADTLLLFGGQDVAQARHWLTQSSAPDARKRVMRTKLEEMVALTEAVTCRTTSLLKCFGEALDQPCGHCDNCEEPPVTADATTEARMVLSAVYRTDQIFGAAHIVAVLRGERTDGVMRHNHDKLRTFGVGEKHAAPYWRGLIRQLIALRALDVDTEGHGGLFLVEEDARPILRGEVTVMLRQDRPRADRAERPERGRSVAAAPPPAAGGGHADAALYEVLRLWRLAEAKGQSIPPYVIFHDSVLREIAALRPSTLDELAQIKGVGASKLERYGRHVLGVLTARIPDGLAKRA